MHQLVFSALYEIVGDPQTIDDHIHELSKMDCRLFKTNTPENYYVKYNDMGILDLKRLYENRIVNWS